MSRWWWWLRTGRNFVWVAGGVEPCKVHCIPDKQKWISLLHSGCFCWLIWAGGIPPLPFSHLHLFPPVADDGGLTHPHLNSGYSTNVAIAKPQYSSIFAGMTVKRSVWTAQINLKYNFDLYFVSVALTLPSQEMFNYLRRRDNMSSSWKDSPCIRVQKRLTPPYLVRKITESPW
jgi:hypothetical protein